MYPIGEPYASGMLDVGDGQLVHWERSGRRRGKPALVLHGGPGSGFSPRWRRWFDPDVYDIVMFDQRGCGRSTPHVGDLSVGLEDNTTHHLIADIERLRVHLDVDRWLVWGGSWGVTLGLAYAERHPAHVSEMVLVSITFTRPEDVHWITRDVGRFFPEAWHRFRDGVPLDERDGDLAAAYDRLINEHPDADVRVEAIRRWSEWEDAILSFDEDPPSRSGRPTREQAAFARLVTRYFSRAAWLERDELLANTNRLVGIPGVLIHGKLDLGGPLDVAWLLDRAWPDARLVVVDSGHSGGEAMDRAIVDATDGFR